MFGHDYFGSQDFLERLHGSICGWQEHRARRRGGHTRHAAPASGPPAATMHSAPMSGSAPAAGPPPAGSPVLVCFHAVQGRLVPVFGNPAEFAGATGQAGDQAPPPATDGPRSPTAQAAPATPQPTPPATTGPQEHTAKAPTTIDPPDFSVQAVQASASSRGAQPTRPTSPERPGAGTVLNLSPPTPPSLVRSDEQAVTVERVLAQHRTEMEVSDARHVAALRDVLTEHRQSLADLLAQHREALREQAKAGTDDAQVFAQLRELLTDQARVMQDEHDRTAGANADLAEMITSLGETVNGLAVAIAERKAPPFGPPPRRPQAPGHEAASVTIPPPPPATPPATQAAAPPEALSHPEPELRDPGAGRPLSVVRSAPTPPAPARSTMTRATPFAASASSSATTPRACVSSVTASLASVFSAAPPTAAPGSLTPHQRRIAEEARQREHVHASIADIDEDDASEGPHG